MRTICIPLLFTAILAAQDVQIPPYYSADAELSAAVSAIAADLRLDVPYDTGEDGMVLPSIAVIDLATPTPLFAGVHAESFIYPASVYKMYVAAEVLRQVSAGIIRLDTPIIVRSPNDVDKTKEIVSDPRPLLRSGDTVSVNFLLDLMITRSDNSAANCLIDLARRENIDRMMQRYNWRGSEVTRKYLSRKLEDPGYAAVRSTETSALHAADFLYRIRTNQLFSPWVSMQMKTFLGRQLDNTKLSAGLPDSVMFYHKTGWYDAWTHDAGIVDDGEVNYIIVCLLPIPEERALPVMKEFAARIHSLFLKRLALRKP
jgi:beta-lactamase class A